MTDTEKIVAVVVGVIAAIVLTALGLQPWQ